MIRWLVHPVDPLLRVAGARDKLLGFKPQSNLILCCLRAITSVNDVSDLSDGMSVKKNPNF